MRRRGLAVVCVLLISLLFSHARGDLEVHFVDVGQGDATLIMCDGESMLIDGGPPSASDKIYAYVRDHVNHLECVIVTHPHADHMGGIPAVLNAVPVDLLFTPVRKWESPIFESIVRYANAQGTQIIIPEEGDVIRIGGAEVTIVHCWPEAWGENDMSIVARVAYQDVSILLTGDAEEMSEYMMIDSKRQLKSDILKIAHHGSRYSTTDTFLEAVSPRYAVISCGSGNDYGHPDKSILQKLKGVELYRTDLQGDIVAKSDGKVIAFEPDRAADNTQLFTAPEVVSRALASDLASETRTYVLNRKTMKIHLPDCDAAREMNPKNRIEYTGTLADLVSQGYEPCRMCLR